MKKSKKGSSLVLVLIVFSVLSILGTAMISLAVSNYKVKIVRGNIKTNMYASESGIDEVYGIIGKMVDGAIIKGNGEVKAFTDALDLSNEMKKKEILKSKIMEKYDLDEQIASLGDVDDAEKDTLIQISQQLTDYIKNSGNDTDYISPTNLVDKSSLVLDQIDLVVNLEYIKEKQNEIFKKNYKNYIISKLYLIDVSNADKKDNLLDAFNRKYIFKMPVDQKSVVYINNFNNSNMSFANDILTVNLESIYKNKNIEKIIKADYEIDTPDYGDTFYVENNSVAIDKNIVWSKAISADGNLKVEDEGKVDIDGNIYIKGIKGDGASSDSGVLIDNTEFSITGYISTLNDLKLLSSNNTTVTGNIYAKNVILTEMANNSKLNSNGSVYTSDDLELNSTEKGEIDIKGAFYGLEKGGDQDNPDTSSSIIINSDDLGTGSSLSIDGKGSIIMGTAYINTTPIKYQTGESLSIKGNYRAYAEPLTNGEPSFKFDNIHFEDILYTPLILAEKFLSNDTPLLVQDRSKYLEYYIEQKKANGETDDIKTEGVYINNSTPIYHTGGIVGNDGRWETIKPYNMTEILKPKKYKYKKIVYFMDEESVTEDDIIKFEDDIKDPDFSASLEVVAKQLKSSGIASNASVENERFIIKNSDYALIFPGADTTKLPGSIPNQNMASEFKGIVIVKGDLYVCGKANFIGTIICTGSVYLVDDNNKSIVYDANIVKNVIATNYDVFKNIFEESSNKINVVIDSQIGSDNNVSSNIDSNELIKLKNWSLVK